MNWENVISNFKLTSKNHSSLVREIPPIDEINEEQTYELDIITGRAPSEFVQDNGLLLPKKKEGINSFILAILNFTNSIIGVGLVGLPYAIMQSGIVLGVSLLLLVTMVVDCSVMLLIRSGRLCCASTYEDLMRKTFGRIGEWVCDVFWVVFSLGGMCAYVIILSDNLTKVFSFYLSNSILVDRSTIIILSTIFILIPLSLKGNLDFLNSLSLLTLVSIVLIIIAIFRELPVSLLKGHHYHLARWTFSDSLGVISFAFVCHHNSFEIHDSLEIPSFKSFSKVTHFSTFISLLTSIILSVPAYFLFLDGTDANILNNFAMDSQLANLSRILLSISLMINYPLDCQVAKQVILKWIFKSRTPPIWSHWCIIIIIASITLSVVLGFRNLSFVLELTGGIAASGLAFIFPPACFLKLAPINEHDRQLRIFAIALLGFGVVVLLFSTINSISNLL